VDGQLFVEQRIYFSARFAAATTARAISTVTFIEEFAEAVP